MTTPFLQTIDWSQPWLAHVRRTAKPILAADDWRVALNDAAKSAGLCNHRGLPVRFVHQEDLPHGVAYEEFISATGGVPTRSNLHDFFNALVWLTFPEIKKQLNALQAAEIATGVKQTNQERAPNSGVRGKLRDAATIFDENAALLVCSDMSWSDALRAHRWREALFEQREAYGKSVDIFLFGHALMEKLVSPYKAITAHTWVVPADPEFFSLAQQEQRAWIDGAVVQQIKNGLQTSNFTPLPVLGIPGWWGEQNEAFYADVQVFRPPRRQT